MNPKSDSAASVDVGAQARALRQARGLSMRAVARASGLSPNALSQIERGNVSPSVSTLNRLAAALGVPITMFFDVGVERSPVVQVSAEQRTRVPFVRGLLEGLGGERFAGHVEPFYLTLESGGASGPHPVVHTGHEFVFCLRGVLEYRVEKELFELGSGDSLLFAAHLRHWWRNPSRTVANAIIVITGFAEGEAPAVRHLGEQANDE